MNYSRFKDMPAWKVAIDIAEAVFKIIEKLPKKEDYGLTSQIRRSALSISKKIAEAFGRYHINHKINFYYSSRGAITETSSHLEYGVKVGYFDQEQAKIIIDKLGNLLEEINNLVKSLISQTKPRPKS